MDNHSHKEPETTSERGSSRSAEVGRITVIFPGFEMSGTIIEKPTFPEYDSEGNVKYFRQLGIKMDSEIPLPLEDTVVKLVWGNQRMTGLVTGQPTYPSSTNLFVTVPLD